MSFVITQDEPLEFNPDFIPYAQHLARLQESYDLAKNSAQTTRMEIIGLCEEQKKLYSQRSPEASYINQGYRDNEWSDDVIYKNRSAYEFKQKLLSKEVDVFTDLAEAASPTQLHELAMCDKEGTTTVYHAAKLLEKTGKVPTKSQIIGHKQGNTNDKFKFYSTIRAEKNRLAQQQVEKESEILLTEKLADTQPEGTGASVPDTAPTSESYPRVKLDDQSEILPGEKLDDQSEILPGEKLDDQSEFRPGTNLAERDDIALRNNCDLEKNSNNCNRQSFLPQEKEQDKEQDNTVTNPDCAQPSLEVVSSDNFTSPNSEVVDVVSMSSLGGVDVSSVSPQEFSKFFQSWISYHYKAVRSSPETKKVVELAHRMLSNYFHF